VLRHLPTARSATTGAPGGATVSRAPSSTASSPRLRRPSAPVDPGGTSGATPTPEEEEEAAAVTVDGGRAPEAAAGL